MPVGTDINTAKAEYTILVYCDCPIGQQLKAKNAVVE